VRIRSTRPHFWRSERIASVSWDARLVLKGLESYVDDNGVGKDDIALIVGDLFQRDLIREPSRTVARVTEAISELSRAGLLWRYRVDGTALLYISFWEECQRIDKPQAGRFPRPDGTKDYKDSIIRECSETPREHSRTFVTGVGEEGSRGVGHKDDDAPPDDPEPPEVVDAVVVEPEHIDNPPRPAKRYASNAAKTVVRQVLGSDYPRTHVDRLAVQVEKLAHEGHPDALIRESLTEWERRPNCDKPEFLPTVLGDVVKASREGPGKVHKLRGYSQLAEEVRAQEEAHRKELA
jgi:hypothetical protein